MTDSARGRAHLEALLNGVEKVVRVSPSDTLVLMGVEDVHSPTEFAHFFEMMRDFGIEAAGVVVLGQGMDVDSIDMRELVRAYSAAAEAPADSRFRTIRQVGAAVVQAPCPRGCGSTIPLPVNVEVGDTGDRMAARAVVDESDLGLHAMVCAGSGNEDV